MTVKNTILKMVREYPGLFKDRGKCLDHLFCTIGNGYEWKDGQLVELTHLRSRGRRRSCVSKRAMEKSLKTLEKINPASAYVHSQKEEKRLERWAVRNAHLLATPGYQDDVPWHYYFYPLSESYSSLLNFPKDIKPDWKAAIIETAKIILKTDPKIKENGKNIELIKKHFTDLENYDKDGSYISAKVRAQRKATMDKILKNLSGGPEK